MLNRAVRVEGRCVCMYYPCTIAIHIPEYKHPRSTYPYVRFCATHAQKACGASPIIRGRPPHVHAVSLRCTVFGSWPYHVEGVTCLMHCIYGVVECLLTGARERVLGVMEGHADIFLSASLLAQHSTSHPSIAGRGAPSFLVPSDSLDGLVYFVGV